MNCITLHCDMNNYFASVEMINHPEYKNIPMAVCGDPATRHGIILAKNYPAKALGILTGESVYSAREKVPELKLIAADYEKYIKYAAAARRIYSDYSCDVVPYGMDEAWLRFPAHDADSLEGYKKAYKTAYIIKERIKRELRLTASVGVSYNYVFSKLASDMKKPDAVTVLQKSQLRSIIWNIPAYEMLFVGPATRKKLCGHNILTIGDIAGSDPVVLSKLLGKTGYNLWQFANGDDSAFNPKVSEDEPYKSIGNTITLPKDAESAEDIYALMYSISKAASVRLRKHKIKSRCVGIKIKYADFSTLNRQVSLQNYTDDPGIIFCHAKTLFDRYYSGKPVRSAGVQVSDFNYSQNEQLSLFSEDEVPADIKNLINKISARIGGCNIDSKGAYSHEIYF